MNSSYSNSHNEHGGLPNHKSEQRCRRSYFQNNSFSDNNQESNRGSNGLLKNNGSFNRGAEGTGATQGTSSLNNLKAKGSGLKISSEERLVNPRRKHHRVQNSDEFKIDPLNVGSSRDLRLTNSIKQR
jgi:hypothetical protein